MSPITMAEVWLVVKNGLWILGLSILLAVWSYARYTAYEARVKTRDKLNEPKYALAVDLGLLLFVAGMAATETRWWARTRSCRRRCRSSRATRRGGRRPGSGPRPG